MVTKLQKTEQGVMLLLPDELLALLGLAADSEVSLIPQPEQGRLVIAPATESLPGIDEEFARQVSDFINQYRPALEALAK
jgi:hypothetical protein